MATRYQIQQRQSPHGEWVSVGFPYDSMTEAEIARFDLMPASVTRVVAVEPLDTVKLSALEAFKRYG